jgi:ATP-binding cassette, subfamily C, bacterial CydCD
MSAADLAASRSSARANSQPRARLLERTALLGLDSSCEQRTGELAFVTIRGIDALDGYCSLNLAQLFLTSIGPVVVIAAAHSGTFRILEIPAGHFLDVLVGLPTPKVFGRAKSRRRPSAR